MRAMQDKDPKDGHTFLFTVDAKTVIDAGVNGNEARFVNHGCDPNCQTVQIGKANFHRSDSHHPAGRGTRVRLSNPARRGRSRRCRYCLSLPVRREELPRQHAGSAPKKRPKKRTKALKKRAKRRNEAARSACPRVSAGAELGVSADLSASGISIQDQFASAAEVAALAGVCARCASRAATLRRPASAGRAREQRREDIRGDFTCWLSEPLLPPERAAAAAPGRTAAAIEPRRILGVIRVGAALREVSSRRGL